MVNGNSFLAPTITGIITRFHQAMPDIKIDDLLEIVSKTVVNSFIPNGWFKKDILHVTFTRKKYIGKKLKIKDSIFVKNLSELNKKISNIEINPKEILFMQFEKIVEGLFHRLLHPHRLGHSGQGQHILVRQVVQQLPACKSKNNSGE